MFSLVLAMSCSKTNEDVTPSTTTLTGKWKHKESVGKLTFTSSGKTKIVDLNDTNDGSVLEFKSDGNAIFEGEAVKYTLTGKAVVLNYGTGKPTIEFTVSKLTSAEMTTSYTLDQCFKYIERYYDTTDPDTRELIKNKATATLTEYTVTYSK
jgi:archaellum component FlaF (FlaF/FlaG flagellin family)